MFWMWREQVRKRLWGEKGVLGKGKNVKWTLVRSVLPALRSSAAIVGSSLGVFFPFFFFQSAMWPLTSSLCMRAVFIGRVPLNQQCSLSHFFPLENDKSEGKHYFVSPHPHTTFPASPPPGVSTSLQVVHPKACRHFIITHTQTCNTWKWYWEQVKHTQRACSSWEIWSGNNGMESHVRF